MRGQAGFFDIDERLKELSAKGDTLARLNGLVDFELFRPDRERAVPRADRSRGGRPPFDHVFMFKVLILQASHSLSDERTEFLIKDRLSFVTPAEFEKRSEGYAGAPIVDEPSGGVQMGFRLARLEAGGRVAAHVLFD